MWHVACMCRSREATREKVTRITELHDGPPCCAECAVLHINILLLSACGVVATRPELTHWGAVPPGHRVIMTVIVHRTRRSYDVAKEPLSSQWRCGAQSTIDGICDHVCCDVFVQICYPDGIISRARRGALAFFVCARSRPGSSWLLLRQHTPQGARGASI